MEHDGASVNELFWPALNFLLFVALLVWYLRGPILEFVRARTERIKDALEVGARARRNAETLRAQMAREIEQLPQVGLELRADMRATAERERDNLLEAGHRAAERIRTDARLLAREELAAARAAIRDEIVEEAIRQATILIREGVRPEDHGVFLQDFLTAAGTNR